MRISVVLSLMTLSEEKNSTIEYILQTAISFQDIWVCLMKVNKKYTMQDESFFFTS